MQTTQVASKQPKATLMSELNLTQKNRKDNNINIGGTASSRYKKTSVGKTSTTQ